MVNSDKSSTIDCVPDTVAVSKLDKRFTVMNMIWLQQAWKTFRTQVDDDYNPKARFENDYSRLQGQIHDFQKFLPPEYRKMLDGGTAAWNFLSDMVRNGQLTKTHYFFY